MTRRILPVLHARLQSVLLQLEAATHTRGALFLVRDASDPWPVLWAKGPDVLAVRASRLVGEPTVWWNSVLGEDRDALRAALEAGGDDCVVEYRVDAGTATRWIRESVRRVTVPELGEHLVSVARDVTAERAAERPAAEEATVPLDPATAGGSGTPVLLVEDDDAVRSVLARVLVREGFTTLLAGSAAEALRVFEKAPRKPCILVCDVILPDRPGPDLARALLRRAPDLPVLFMSGYGHDELERRGDVALGHPLLPKPFTPSDLVQAVRACLDVRRPGGSGVMSGPESAAC